jgi:hypothetical protein
MAENRAYSKVKTNVKALIRKAIEEGSPPFFRVNTEQGFHFDFNCRELGIPEGLNLYFQYLDGKLDLILSMLGKEMIEKEFDFSTMVVELSGGGLKCLKISEEFNVGDHIEMLLYLSHIPLLVVSAIGEIIRIEKDKDKEYFIVEFTNIRERDRELIVRFVFQEQREQIRISRGKN